MENQNNSDNVNINYLYVKPNSHYWTSVEMLLNYLEFKDSIDIGYLRIGLQNCRDAGYDLRKIEDDTSFGY